MLIVLVSFVPMLFKFSYFLYFFSAIHGSAADALADVSGVEGGERAVAGGAAGDVDGPQRDAGGSGPELHRQKSGKFQLLVGQEAAEQDAGECRHPVDNRRTNFDRIIFFCHKNMSSHVWFPFLFASTRLLHIKDLT